MIERSSRPRDPELDFFLFRCNVIFRKTTHEEKIGTEICETTERKGGVIMNRQIFQDALERMEQSKHFRLVALGASNTERYMPGIHWTDVLELGLRSRFGRKFQLINAGVSGNNTREALARFDRDVAFFQPALVIVTLGGNDCRTDQKSVSESEFRENLEAIGSKIEVLDAIPIFQTYYKMDLEAMDPVRAERFVRNMEIIREVAEQHSWHLVDQYAVFEKVDPVTHRYELMINAMHTNEQGNILIGIELLRHFDIDPLKIGHPEKLLPAIRLRERLD